MPFFSTLKFLNNEISIFFDFHFESATPPYTLLRPVFINSNNKLIKT